MIIKSNFLLLFVFFYTAPTCHKSVVTFLLQESKCLIYNFVAIFFVYWSFLKGLIILCFLFKDCSYTVKKKKKRRCIPNQRICNDNNSLPPEKFSGPWFFPCTVPAMFWLGRTCIFREAICTVPFCCSCLCPVASQQRTGLNPATITGSSRAQDLGLEIPKGWWVCRTDSCQYMKHRHTCQVKPCVFLQLLRSFDFFRTCSLSRLTTAET